MQRRLRLTRSEDFERLRQTGQSRSHAWLVMNVAANQLPHNRYGIITTKKLGKAVQRNRIKRQLREVLRLLHSQLRQGYDVVIIARPGIMGQPFHAIQRIVEQACHKLMLLSGDGG